MDTMTLNWTYKRDAVQDRIRAILARQDKLTSYTLADLEAAAYEAEQGVYNDA